MRNSWIGSVVLAAALAAPGAAGAQDAKAADVLAAARKAIGDRKIDSLKTLSVDATVQRNMGERQMQTLSQILLDFPDKYVRTDESMMGMNLTTGFNGEKAIVPAGASFMPGGGMMIRMGGGPASEAPSEKPTPEQLEELNRASLRTARQDISRLLLGWLAMTHPSLNAQYTYAGEAESPDGKAHVIDVKDADGFAARLFVDQATHLPLMVTYRGRQPRAFTSFAGAGGGPPAAGAGQPRPDPTPEEIRAQLEAAPMVEFTLFFDDWRQVEGITFPHVIRRASGGTTTEEWTVSKVKVNPKIDAKKFDVDAK